LRQQRSALKTPRRTLTPLSDTINLDPDLRQGAIGINLYGEALRIHFILSTPKKRSDFTVAMKSNNLFGMSVNHNLDSGTMSSHFRTLHPEDVILVSLSD